MKSNELTNILLLKINNLSVFLEKYSANEIFIAEYEDNRTCYLLKNIDFDNNTCIIQVRSSHGREDAPMLFDRNIVFSIYNSDEICFIPIDGKGLLKGSNCDFIFYNERNFCFVELKLNVTSLQEQSVQGNREKAIQQLTNTIDFFDETLNRYYCGLTIEAFVATPDFYPRENAAFQTLKVRFKETTQVDLFESREKRYW